MRLNEDNAFNAYLYFCRLFKLADSTFAESDVLLHSEKLYEASKALDNIVRLAHKDGNYAPYLNKWLDDYITEKGWLRCLNALRQKHYIDKKRHSPEGTVRVQISYLSNYRLAGLAKTAGLTKKAMLEQLISEASKQDESTY